MRLKTVTATDARTALAEIRASLGPDAMLVLSQPLKNGRVRVTAAIDDDDPDLDAVLGQPPCQSVAPWFQSLADHHGLREPLRGHLGAAVASCGEGDSIASLGQALLAHLRFQPLEPERGGCLLLSGPPGAGKTLTTAKLAARAALAGQQVEVVSADVERAGGLAPLRALLAPLGITPRPAAETGAVAAGPSPHLDLLVIDTPAINPFRSADVARLSQLIERCGSAPILVLPAGHEPADAAEIAATYAALGAERMIATRLDVARRFGGMLAASDAGLALSEAGIAPTVGGGLRPLTASGLSRLLLHGPLRQTRKPAEARP